MGTLLFALATVTAVTACSSEATTKHVGAAESRVLLIDRNWLDHMPDSEKDKLFVYRFVPNMGGGVFQERTLFKGTFELFSFAVTEDKINFVLHETKQNVSSPFTIERVDGPKPFDLKLTIKDDPRGPHVYYGMQSETDRDGSKLEQRLHASP